MYNSALPNGKQDTDDNAEEEDNSGGRVLVRKSSNAAAQLKVEIRRKKQERAWNPSTQPARQTGKQKRCKANCTVLKIRYGKNQKRSV
jgi:hypothetical protein